MLKGLLEEEEEEEMKKGTQVQREKMAMNKYLSIITISVNALNAPMKRYRVAGWTRKHDIHMYCLQENHLRTNNLHRLKVKAWKKCPKETDMKIKKSWGSNTYIRYNRLQNKGHKKRQRRSLHNT